MAHLDVGQQVKPQVLFLKKIRIGPVDYLVRTNPRYKAENLVGQILYYESIIEMQEDLSPAMLRIGLWHEALHGLLIQGGFREHDERLLDVLSSGIVRLLQDNPQLGIQQR